MMNGNQMSRPAITSAGTALAEPIGQSAHFSVSGRWLLVMKMKLIELVNDHNI